MTNVQFEESQIRQATSPAFIKPSLIQTLCIRLKILKPGESPIKIYVICTAVCIIVSISILFFAGGNNTLSPQELRARALPAE